MNLGSLPRALQCLCLVFAAGGMPAYGQDTTAVGCDLSEMGASDPAYIGSTIGSGSSHIDLGADLDRFEDAETAWHVVWTTNDALAVEWSDPGREGDPFLFIPFWKPIPANSNACAVYGNVAGAFEHHSESLLKFNSEPSTRRPVLFYRLKLNDDEVVARDDGGFWLKLGRAVLTAAGELQSVFANVSVRPSEDGDGLVRVTITTSSPDIGIAFTESAFPKGFEQLSSMSKARGFDVFSGPFVKVFGADAASGMPERWAKANFYAVSGIEGALEIGPLRLGALRDPILMTTSGPSVLMAASLVPPQAVEVPQ